MGQACGHGYQPSIGERLISLVVDQVRKDSFVKVKLIIGPALQTIATE